MAKKGLGRGLDALLADNSADLENNNGIAMIRISDIEPNRKQARKVFDSEALEELAASITQHGILQPVVLRKQQNGFYEIIAGERRWRASKMVGLSEIPAIIKDTDEKSAGLMSLVENLQRENLNPVEEANGYREIIDRFDLTQEEAAKKVGKSRASVANLLRILNLPNTVLDLVSANSMSYGHARTLLPLMDSFSEKEFIAFAETVVSAGLSVRDTERFVKQLLEKNEDKTSKNTVLDEYYKQLEKRIRSSMGRRVTIKEKKNGEGGQLAIAYSSSGDLEQLLKNMCGTNIFDEDGE